MKTLRSVLGLVLLLAASVPAVAETTAPAVFESGDRWCALGDSITASGQYFRYIELFYLTRFPEKKLEVVNSGINGDTASAVLKRLDWDCLDAKPTVVSVMLGMNDVGRSSYKLEYRKPTFEAECAERAETYEQGMRQVVKRLVEAGVKVILFTPSIFDDTADLPRTNLPDCGTALRGYGRRVQAIAGEFAVATVDFSGPMTAINAEQQKRDPHFSIVGPDRVHPTEPGHLVMAYEFLRAQGLTGAVSRITIDAAEGKAGSLENCAVENLKIQVDEISFTCLENSLPFPVEAKAVPALELIPFMQEFNQEILQVRGLTPGDYELSIDGKKIRTFKATELAAGVNLAAETSAPQFQQAVAVRSALHQKWPPVISLRSIAYIEHNAWPEDKRPLLLDQISTDLDVRLAKLAGADEGVKEKLKTSYLERKTGEAKLHREAADAANAARQTAQPKPHAFTLRRSN
jgi:lysophospholipase L1-like esterase